MRISQSSCLLDVSNNKFCFCDDWIHWQRWSHPQENDACLQFFLLYRCCGQQTKHFPSNDMSFSFIAAHVLDFLCKNTLSYSRCEILKITEIRLQVSVCRRTLVRTVLILYMFCSTSLRPSADGMWATTTSRVSMTESDGHRVSVRSSLNEFGLVLHQEICISRSARNQKQQSKKKMFTKFEFC